MFKVKLILLAAIFITDSDAYSPRIINGTRAALGEFPYIVSIQQIAGNNACGGSIIDDTHILTAAHCVYGFDEMELYIQYGVVDLAEQKNRVKVSDRFYHVGFARAHGYFDIAILRLEESIKFDDNTKPTVLPEAWAPTPEEYTPATLAGWGLIHDISRFPVRYLMKVDLIIFSDEKCEAYYKEQQVRTNSEIQLCSAMPEGGKGQCRADSGGPLYANGVQVGLVSWSLKPCAQKGYPGVFTKVSKYIEWINLQIQKQKKN